MERKVKAENIRKKTYKRRLPEDDLIAVKDMLEKRRMLPAKKDLNKQQAKKIAKAVFGLPTDTKIKRQGLTVTIAQLRKLANELEDEIKDHEKKYNFSGWGTKFQINIINKEGLSDTWEIEDD